MKEEKKSRKLIINADDFGINLATNAAIKELYQAGRITSVSLLTGAEATEDAMAVARELNMPVGVHLTLNSDFESRPWKSMYYEEVGKHSLCDEEGHLFYDLKKLRKVALSKDVTKECTLQIERVATEGIRIDHLDNHSGTMYGINMRLFFINAFRLAKEYDLPFRFPKSVNFLADAMGKDAPFYIKLAHSLILLTAKGYGVRMTDNLVTNPYPIDKIENYKELEQYYLNKITNLEAGVTEMFLHPSYPYKSHSKLTKEWLKREFELEFLMSETFMTRLQDEGIELVGYGELHKMTN